MFCDVNSKVFICFCLKYEKLNCLSFRTIIDMKNEASHVKSNSLGFQPGLTQTGLYSHRSRLEA